MGINVFLILWWSLLRDLSIGNDLTGVISWTSWPFNQRLLLFAMSSVFQKQGTWTNTCITQIRISGYRAQVSTFS